MVKLDENTRQERYLTKRQVTTPDFGKGLVKSDIKLIMFLSSSCSNIYSVLQFQIN